MFNGQFNSNNLGNQNVPKCAQYLTNYTDSSLSRFIWKFSPKFDRVSFYPDDKNDTTNFNSATFIITLLEPPPPAKFIGISVYDPGN